MSSNFKNNVEDLDYNPYPQIQIRGIQEKIALLLLILLGKEIFKADTSFCIPLRNSNSNHNKIPHCFVLFNMTFSSKYTHIYTHSKGKQTPT